MSDLKVVQFNKIDEPTYDEFFQDVRSLVWEKYQHLSTVEVCGLLNCLLTFYTKRSMVFHDE